MHFHSYLWQIVYLDYINVHGKAVIVVALDQIGRLGLCAASGTIWALGTMCCDRSTRHSRHKSRPRRRIKKTRHVTAI